MHSFYIREKGDLDREEARHAFRVLRLKAGDAIEAIDGAGGRFEAVIAELGEDGGRVEIVRELPSNEAPVRLTVYQGVPKADKLELLAQKLTELGARRLAPVRMERCVAKPDDREAIKRAQRLERISQEAVKHCGRALPMEITGAMRFEQALEDMGKQDLVLLPWEEAKGTRMKDVFRERPDARNIGIVIGPEGGITEQEVRRMRETMSVLRLPGRDRAVVEERMERQLLNAREWRDVTNTFFHRLSGVPDAKGRKIYD